MKKTDEILKRREFIRSNHDKLNIKQASEQLGVSQQSCFDMAKNLGVKFKPMRNPRVKQINTTGYFNEKHFSNWLVG